MKLRIYTIIFVFILAITFLFCRPSMIQESNCEPRQTIEEIESLIEIKGSTVEDPDGTKIRKLAEKIHSDYQKLCSFFEKKEKGFEKEMAKILGSKTSINPFDGESIHGIGGLKKLFLKRKNEGYNRAEFELKEACVFYEGRKVLLVPKYDYIAYKVFTIHWIKAPGRKIIKNQDDEGEGSSEHSLGCRWPGR